MKLIPRCLPALLFLSLLLTSIPAVGQASAPLTNGLEDRVALAEDGEMVPVLIGLDNAYDPARLYNEVQGMSLPARRAYAIETLRSHFAKVSAPVAAWLQAEQAAGRAQRVQGAWIGHAFLADIRADRVMAVAELPGVSRVRYDAPLRFDQISDELPAGKGGSAIAELDEFSWMLDTCGVSDLWAQGYKGEGVLIAILDSGVDVDHADLVNQMWVNPGEIAENGVDDDGNGFVDDINGWDFVDESNDVSDVQGHGTKCSGVVAGDGTQGDTTGVAPDCEFMTLRIYASSSSSEGRRTLAVQYAAANGADVLTSSLSYKRSDTYTPDYVTHRYSYQYLLAMGVIAVNSTGNSAAQWGPPWEVSAPANCPAPFLHPDQTIRGGRTAVLGIGAFEDDLEVPYFSDNGPSVWEELSYPEHFRDYPYDDGNQLGLLKPDVLGPSGLPTTSWSGSYTNFNGTSSSTPAVGGMFVLLRQIHPQATPEQLAEGMMMGAFEGGEPGMDNEWGAGQVRVDDAHAYLDAMMPYGSLLVQIDAAGPVPDGIVLEIGDGEIVKPVANWTTGAERVLEGTYTVRLSYGQQERVFTGVEILEDEITTLEVDGLVDPVSVSPLQVTGTFTNMDAFDVDFTLSNPGPETRTVKVSIEPRGGLDWEVDSEFPADIHEVYALAQDYKGIHVFGEDEAGDKYRWIIDPRSLDLVSEPLPERFQTLVPLDVEKYAVDVAVLADDWVYVIRDYNGLTLTDSLSLDGMLQDPVAIGYATDFDDGGYYVADNERRTVEVISEDGDWVRSIDLDGLQVRALSAVRGGSTVYGPPRLYLLAEDLEQRRWIATVDLDTDEVTVERPVWQNDNPPMSLTALREEQYLPLTVATATADGQFALYNRELPDNLELTPVPPVFDLLEGETTETVTVWGMFLRDGSQQDPNPNLFQFTFTDLGSGQRTVVPAEAGGYWLSVEDGFDDVAALPTVAALEAAYPNPFNASVTLRYALPATGEVTLAVYDVLGREVAPLQRGERSAGRHTVTWSPRELSSGVYFVQLQAGDARDMRKVVFVK